MKALYVSDITDGAQVEADLFVARKALLRSRSGSPYLSLTLTDRTGQIEGRVWEEAERLAAHFGEGDFLRVRARAEVFREALQLSVADIVRLDPAVIELADFLPASEHKPQDMLRKLKILGRSIKNPYLNALIEAFFTDRPFMAALSRSAAAKNMHHAYLGGLLEHTLSVALLTQEVALHYPDADRDLLLAAAILHDIGKVRELSCAPGFDYTAEGRLIGHLLLGVEMIEQKLAVLKDFPPELATSLKHLIISHHGEYEFGSPKRPKTAEAFILHALDDLDAKLNAVRLALKAAGTGTAYHRVLERYIFGPRQDSAPAPAEEPPEEAAEASYPLLQPLLKKR
jgi:3'-5' exoribonuclease